MVTMRGSSLVLLAAAAAAPASLFSDPVSMHFGGEALPPARAQPAPKAPRDDSFRGKLSRSVLKAATVAARKTSDGLAKASTYLDGTATRAEGARQLLKTLKKKDGSKPERPRLWPSPRPTPFYNTTRHRRSGRSSERLVFRAISAAAELWRRFNLLRERSLLGMLVLAFALGRATRVTRVAPGRRWCAWLYLLLKWLCVIFSLQAVLQDPSLNAARVYEEMEPALHVDLSSHAKTADLIEHNIEAVWRAGLGAFLSRRATQELRRALRTLDSSFEVREAALDFGLVPPRIREARRLKETPAFLASALEERSGARKPSLAFALDVEAWAIDAPAFLTLDLELRGRFAKYAVPRIGAVFEDAELSPSTLLVAVEVSAEYPFLDVLAFAFDGAPPKLRTTALVGEDADAASLDFPLFSDSIDDEIRKALPTAPEAVAFDLGEWLVECNAPEAVAEEAEVVVDATRQPAPRPRQWCDEPTRGWRKIARYARCRLPRPDSVKATARPTADMVERRKRLLDAAASLGAEHDSLVQEARGRLRRQLAQELQSLAPFRFNRRKLQAHSTDEPMRARAHFSQPDA